MEIGGRPTAEDVISKLKDDGDFDTLRLKIIRKVKENGELRDNIIKEVKQSLIVNEDGSENLKPRQLSDGIYREIGSKIMGQISDEIWKIIRSSDDMKNEIREMVELVYNRLISSPMEKEDHSSSPHQPSSKKKKEGHSSPPHQPLSKRKKEHRSSLPSQEPVSGNADVMITPSCETRTADGGGPTEPRGFAPFDQQNASDGNMEEQKQLVHDRRPGSSIREEHYHEPEKLEELPPGFAPGHSKNELPVGVSDEDPDLPPGFGC